jgi:hypothetical protein
VRCAIDYRPKAGGTGPAFRLDFILTPDGILATATRTSLGAGAWGVTWPLLENDGRALNLVLAPRIASTGYPGSADRQNFLALGSAAIVSEPALRGSYGDLRPVRVTVHGDSNRTFIYPAAAGDPSPEAVLRGFAVTAGGFRSPLGRVSGTLYYGRTSAGGFGNGIDLGSRGTVKFSAPCGFLLRIESNRITAVETDRAVTARIGRRTLELKRYEPVDLP